MKINIKRAYDNYSKDDGYRILVDRLWPRGIRKEDLKCDFWAKDIAPSSELRKWFSHDPEKWNEFQEKYFEELNEKTDLLKNILNEIKSDVVTLVYSAKNTEQNQAVVIKEYIENKIINS